MVINLRKLMIGGIILIIVIIGIVTASAGFYSDNGNSTIITYGETTFDNQQYKSVVDDYFVSQSNVNLNDVKNEIITASEVNAISQGISHRTYTSNQIFSSALVDLDKSSNLEINVDHSKITLVTEEMYASALESAGINEGYVIVTSPVSATGESALAGIMNCYEQATNTTMPTEVKQAANNQIYVESEVVNSSNVSAESVSDLVDDVKEEVNKTNTTDIQTIIKILTQTAEENNMNLSEADIEKLAESISQTQSVQDQAQEYSQQISQSIGNAASSFSLENLFNF